MLLKCRLIIVIFFLEIIFSVADKKVERKLKKTSLDLINNPNANRMKLNGQSGKTRRFLTGYNPITCDGYILTIFRLSSEIIPSKGPVLLAHGLYQSSDRWIQETPEKKSLAFALQDLGFDVWLFNARGNKYSRQHINLVSECDEKWEFFDYSYEEIGVMDIAASVDFILNMTLFKKIHFVGHSLGGTEFLVLNSLKPEYNALFETAFLLAPYSFQRYYRNSALKWLFQNTLKEKNLVDEGTVELFPYLCTKEEFKFAPEECLGDKKYKKMCDELQIQETMGLNSDTNTQLSTRGGSTKQLLHLGQNILTGAFKRFKYSDNAENAKHYGDAYAPDYNLALITVPTTIYYSITDEYIHRNDIKELAKKMANATVREVAKGDFKHDEFVNSTYAMFFVYNGIIKTMKQMTEILPKPGKKPTKPGNPSESPKEPSTTAVMVLVLAGAGFIIAVCIALVYWMFATNK